MSASPPVTAEGVDGTRAGEGEAAYDVVLVVGFGGPESAAEVMPFLERVTAGRGVPRERLELVAENYRALGGRSPLNDQNRALLEDLLARLGERGVHIDGRLCHRNTAPFVAEQLREVAAAGHRRVLALAVSAYPSYSGCRQYREDLAAGLAEAGLGDAVDVVKVSPFCREPWFVEASACVLAAALERSGPDPLLLVTTHSLPVGAAAASGLGGGYVAEHERLAEAAVARASALLGMPHPPRWRLVFQSRSGPPHVPWLEPDVNDALRDAAAEGVLDVVVAPLGFLSDHVEVLWDLDREAAATAAGLGQRMVRAATVGERPEFRAGLAAHLSGFLTGLPTGAHRAPVAPSPPAGDAAAPEGSAGGGGPAWCSPDCCLHSARPSADEAHARPRPVVAGTASRHAHDRSFGGDAGRPPGPVTGGVDTEAHPGVVAAQGRR